ncbi:MAG: CubicO group peptidase (beta-lactamase class C family), partial [Hydrogenophaga sp.]
MNTRQNLSRVEPADLGLCPDRTQRLLQVLQGEVDRGYIPGAVVLLARHGQIALHQAIGQLDPGAGSPMTTDAVFRIYSMTKPVVSVAAMMLVEQGRLLLTDLVAKYLPEFAKQSVAVERGTGLTLEPVAQSATVQDLLRHTAGLTYEFLGSAHVQRLYAQAQIGSRARSNAAFSDTLAAMPLFYQPGSQWAYSRATDVLGRLLEVVSGQTLGEHLAQTIFAPLGM